MNSEISVQEIRKYLERYIADPQSVSDQDFENFGSAGVAEIFRYGADLISKNDQDTDQYHQFYYLTRLFDVAFYALGRGDSLYDGIVAGCSQTSPELSKVLDMFDYGSQFSLSYLLMDDVISNKRSFDDNLILYLIENDPWIYGGKLRPDVLHQYLRGLLNSNSQRTRTKVLHLISKMAVPQLMPLLVEIISLKLERHQLDDEDMYLVIQALLKTLWWPERHASVDCFYPSIKPILDQLGKLPVVMYSAKKLKEAVDSARKNYSTHLRYNWQEPEIVGPHGRQMMRDAEQGDYRKLHAWVDECIENDYLEVRFPDFIRVITNAGEDGKENASRFLAELEIYLLKNAPARILDEVPDYSISSLRENIHSYLLRAQLGALEAKTTSNSTGDLGLIPESEVVQKLIDNLPKQFDGQSPILYKYWLTALADIVIDPKNQDLSSMIGKIRKEVLRLSNETRK